MGSSKSKPVEESKTTNKKKNHTKNQPQNSKNNKNNKNSQSNKNNKNNKNNKKQPNKKGSSAANNKRSNGQKQSGSGNNKNNKKDPKPKATTTASEASDKPKKPILKKEKPKPVIETLHQAVRECDSEAAKNLIRQGHDSNAEDYDGKSPMDRVVEKVEFEDGNTNMAELAKCAVLLMKEGGKVTKGKAVSYDILMTLSISAPNANLCKIVLEQDKFNFAKSTEDKNIFRVIHKIQGLKSEEKKKKVTAAEMKIKRSDSKLGPPTSSDSGKSEVLDHKARTQLDQLLKILEQLLRSGVDANSVDQDLRTPLHHVVLNPRKPSAQGAVDMLIMLMDYGADKTLCDRWGANAIGLCENELLETIMDNRKAGSKMKNIR